MKARIALSVFLTILLLGSIPASATWSIIIVDSKTKEIGIAGASCTPSVYGIGAIIPGKGAIIVQAMSNKIAQMTGIQMIMNGRSPKEIIDSLRNEWFDPENQQYSVVCLYKTAAVKTYTGKNVPAFSGVMTGKGISVQGNTLSDTSEIRKIMEAVLKAQKQSLPIGEQLMAALEAGSLSGGDRRCGKQRASSAFITISKATDDIKKPSLNLIVSNLPIGGPNAVAELRKKYNQTAVKK
ncbi:DUF1028 domain-containing protein [Niabella sp.]|uniref:DUF1028 domain-containing protein n=1 Tax=Niabella sp. TaxID=1962976 RepID=UPI00262A84B1|nr:DUF1028 domain-containing protein [Niabella sp.]